MDKGMWENIQRSLVPNSLLPGILGPAPAPRDGLANQALSIPRGMGGGSPPFGKQGMPVVLPPPPPSTMVAGQPPAEAGTHFDVPPPLPGDLEMVQGIEMLAAVVAKFGLQHEALAKKHPKFVFLYGGEPGSDAARGLQYYEWKKVALMRVVDAGKAVAEGTLRPDHLKAMERELERFSYGNPIKAADIRPDSIASMFEPMERPLSAKTEDGHRRSHFEEPELRRSGLEEPRSDSKNDRPRRDPQRIGMERSNDSRSKRRRSRSRSRTRSPVDRRRRRRSPPRRRHRSHSRSPRQTSRMSPPPRRDVQRGDAEREMRMNHGLRREPPYGNHRMVLPPPPAPPPPPPPQLLSLHAQQQQQLHQQQQGPSGFLESSYGPYRNMNLGSSGMHQQAPAQHAQEYTRLQAPFPSQVVAPFEIPVHQQQILLQLLSQVSTSSAGTLVSPPPSQQFLGVAPLPLLVPQQQQQQQSTQHDVGSSPPDEVEVDNVASPSQSSSRPDENGGNGNGDGNNDDSDDVPKGKSEKDGSRALKFVRNAVADLVKELLNPKWKEGILSKNDFKVIAKKAVDKVVGNLQGSQIPKGQERVEKFMASSKEKITKLVQEYVDKHSRHKDNKSNGTHAVEASAAGVDEKH